MLTEPTLEKLNALRLGAMAAAYARTAGRRRSATPRASTNASACSSTPSISRARTQRSPVRLKEAKLRLPQACLEDIDYAPRRELDQALLRQLATGRWVAEHHNVLITGATGVGKTYVACALAQHACRQGSRAIYRAPPRLFRRAGARARRRHLHAVLARLARVDVLVLDDWGLAP